MKKEKVEYICFFDLNDLTIVTVNCIRPTCFTPHFAHSQIIGIL